MITSPGIEIRIPETHVIFYREKDGGVPLLVWLDALPDKVQLKCLGRIERLKQEGHALRRPEADFLRNKIYELRIGFQGMNYRMLYFFHGIVKEAKVPPGEIEKAIKRMENFLHDPELHTYKERTDEKS